MATKNSRMTNGVSHGCKYTITSSGVNVAAVAEILTLTVTHGCSTSGNLSVVLRGATPVTIAVLDTDDLTTEVATKIRAGTYPGWTPGGSGSDVTFTATVAGLKTGANTLGVAATGVTGTYVVTTPGADAINNYVDFDFRATTGIGTYRYPLVANVIVTRAGAIVVPTDLSIAYPVAGVVRVDGVLVSGDIIHVVAMRDSELVTF
jgi:hypothetical protein